MMEILDVLMVILVVLGILYVVNGVCFLVIIFRNEPDRTDEQPSKKLAEEIDRSTTTPKESILDACLRGFREEDERRAREQAQWATHEHIRITQETHDVTAISCQHMLDDTAHADDVYSSWVSTDGGAMAYADDYDYDYDCGCCDWVGADCCSDDIAIQNTFALAADLHNSAVNDAAFTAQSDFSMFGAGGFGF